MPVKERRGAPPQSTPLPGVVVGDHVYIRHVDGPTSGCVLAHGRDGATVDVAGTRHKVPWQHVLGHKRRVAQTFKIEDEGEDGMIARDAGGKRHYIGIPPEAREDRLVAKSLGAGARPIVLLKADAPYMGRPGLAKKQITDKNGVQTTRWVSTGPADAPVAQGAHIGFRNGQHAGHGEVTAAGRDGVTVRDPQGGVHRVPHAAVTHRWEGEGRPDAGPHEAVQAPEARPEVKPHQGDPDTFIAADFAAQHNDPAATPESIIAGFGGDAAERVEAARRRLAGIRETHETHRQNGEWSPERAALHRKIIFDGVEVNGKKVPGLLAPDRIKAATPLPGEAPTFIALGGRGGSGKSSLNGRVYDEARAIVLDADHIKGMLPEYQGWNAHQVHEESSELLGSIMTMAKLMGLNVVFDATMKSTKPVQEYVDAFKSAGFRTEAHYMHLPRQEAAKRAIGRFLNGGERGRFVPPEVVLGNTANEANFDKVKGKVDAWTFHDNSGEKGAGPKLIAGKGTPKFAAKKVMLKSEQGRRIVLFRKDFP